VTGDLAFRRLVAADLPLLHEWLQREHVRRWWRDHETYEQVVEHYLPAIEGRDPTDLYLAVLDGRAVGFAQTYLVADYPDYAALVRAGTGAAGLDVLVGEPELTGRGLGSRIVDVFASEIVFAAPAVTACVADPDKRNVASIRAFEKAGFHRTREFVDPADGETHVLLRRKRGQ
jgi:aminoglycoside 6'-N-acetyltransferase